MKLGKRQNLYEWLKRVSTGRGRPRALRGMDFCYVLTWRWLHRCSGGSDGKESACNAGGLGLIPGLGKSPEGGHGNSPQYSPHGQRSLAGCAFHGVPKSQSRLSDYGHVKTPGVALMTRAYCMKINRMRKKKDLKLEYLNERRGPFIAQSPHIQG